MSPSETSNLIKKAGGDTAFGTLLGITKGKWQQRVNNWKRRGLPASVELEHYDTLQSLQAKQDRKRA
jgi:hypothetical protein